MAQARRSHASPLSLVRADEVDDAELGRRLRAGDPSALGLLFDRYGLLVNRLLLRLLGGGADHDDRVQETFLQVLRAAPSLRDEHALKAWITTITVRVARAELRRRRLRRIFFLQPSEDAPPDVPLPDDLAAREALRATWRVLDALPTEERLAFVLRFLHDQELTDVAAACGCSLATIKRRLASAEARFLAVARRHPELAARIARGDRWGTP